ncbi:hypothetical protein H5410_036101 [Solanum commersonii]|uniref:Uncharacterized protein n=1 Tax=Solanum commersonii TaxID=4109 RepID=A0A9J5Y3S7_SOLCO|nr:hypothetical protein H5410_036101 [Solanum commersonii]
MKQRGNKLGKGKRESGTSAFHHLYTLSFKCKKGPSTPAVPAKYLHIELVGNHIEFSLKQLYSLKYFHLLTAFVQPQVSHQANLSGPSPLHNLDESYLLLQDLVEVASQPQPQVRTTLPSRKKLATNLEKRSKS